jgi:uncharacterized membrane protein YccC
VQWFAGATIVGALLTALGFALGGGNWGLVALAAFLVALLGGFAAAYGKLATQVAFLLVTWFVITLALPLSYALIPWPAQPWPQALAWLAGGALWILLTFVLSLRHRDRPPSPSNPPPQSAPVSLSQPLIIFSVVRALAVFIAVAIAWGFALPHANWMPIAVLIVMRPSLNDTLFRAEQRVTGAILGALLATAVLAIVHGTDALGKDLLVAFIVVSGALAGATQAVNYAIFCTFVAASVLVSIDLPTPGNYSANWERVAWTVVGAAIGLVLTLLLNELAARGHRTSSVRATGQMA